MFNLILYKIGKFIAMTFPLKASYFIASVICYLQFYLSAKDRKAVLYNIKRVMPGSGPKTVRKVSRQVFKNFGKYLVDFFRFSKIDREFIANYVRIKNIGYLDEALKEYPGVVALSAHLGNFELGGAVLAKLGYPFYAVALSHTYPKVNHFFNRQRASCGVNVIPVGLALRRCYQLLTGKNVIAFLGDRDFYGAGVEFNFCGRKALIPRGPAAFSIKTKAAIVPVFIVRDSGDYFSLIFEEPISPLNDNGHIKSERQLIREYLEVIEEYVKRYPFQWYMFQPFFKE